MSEWFDSQKKPSGNFRRVLQERIEKANPRRELTAEGKRRLSKLEAIADKLKRGESVQNRQLQTWLTDDQYVQIEAEWQEQIELRVALTKKMTKRETKTMTRTVALPKTKIIKQQPQQQTTPKDLERTGFTPIRPQPPLPNQQDDKDKR